MKKKQINRKIRHKPAKIKLLTAGILALLLNACTKESEQTKTSIQYLSNDNNLYQQVSRDNQVQLPRDHWPHPLFQHEWWYLNALLR